MRLLVAAFVFLAGLFAAIYVGYELILVAGIQTILDGANASPSNAHQIAWGVIQAAPLAEMAFGIVFWIGINIAIWIADSDSFSSRGMYPRRQGRLTNRQVELSHERLMREGH